MAGREGNAAKESYETGSLVKSLAGHDKDQIFVILREEGEYLYLADGKNRMVEKPKKKNKKHIQVIHKKQEALSRKLQEGISVDNAEIKTFIRKCKKEDV